MGKDALAVEGAGGALLFDHEDGGLAFFFYEACAFGDEWFYCDLGIFFNLSFVFGVVAGNRNTAMDFVLVDGVAGEIFYSS